MTTETELVTETSTTTTWPQHGPDSSQDFINQAVLINQLSPGINYSLVACAPTTTAMILAWMNSRNKITLPYTLEPIASVKFVNYIETYEKTDATGTKMENVLTGLNRFSNKFGINLLVTVYWNGRHYDWSRQSYKDALDEGSAVILFIHWKGGGGHYAWGTGLGGSAPYERPWAGPEGFAPMTIADPWGGVIVGGWVDAKGYFEYINPAMGDTGFGHGVRQGAFVGMIVLSPINGGSDPVVEGFSVVASDGNYYIINATDFGDVMVTNGQVSGIDQGLLLRASGRVYGYTNGTVLVPPDVSVTVVNPTNFPNLSLSIINGTETFVDPPGTPYVPSLSVTPISPLRGASVTGNSVGLAAKVTVNGTGVGSSPVGDATVHFFVNDKDVGSAVTNSTGVAMLDYTPEASGTFSWYAKASSADYPEETSWPPSQFSIEKSTGLSGVGGLAFLLIPVILIVLVVLYVRARRRRAVAPQAAAATTPRPYPPPPPVEAGVKYCIDCGAEMPSSTQYCTKCGSKQ